jgi:hypothetical protein
MPNVFINTPIYLISFALSSILVSHITSPKEGDFNISISGFFQARLHLCLMGQSLMPVTKEKN